MFPLDFQMKEAKSSLTEVPKKWGKEIIIVNCPEYCGKLLCLDKGAVSSYHYHKDKKETFYCLKGQVGLNINGKDYMLNPWSRPKTIYPEVPHSFTGISDSIVLEISTHHEDKDVIRLTESNDNSKS